MTNTARSLMILGTAAGVGKSAVCVGLCRWLYRKGETVVPFKAINVAVSLFRTKDGTHLNLAQAQQAVASGQAPVSTMNPVLFDLTDEGRYEILTHGKPADSINQLDLAERADSLRPIILDSYSALSSTHRVVVIEGCGSPVEMNVKERDISNLWLAEASDSKCILVADIERCGVFASLLGTIWLMSDDEKERVGGFIVNKFHGSTDSFQDGVKILEDRGGIPCLGVIPKLDDLNLATEDWMDSLSPEVKQVSETKSGFSQHELDEVDRWTDHLLQHCDEKAIASLVDL